MQGNLCMSYLEGFVDGKGTELKYRCLAEVSYSKMAAAYVAWMAANPSAMKMSKSAGLEMALERAFCFRTK